MHEYLKKGTWVTRLLSLKKVGRKKYMDWYFVGIFETCQEAYFQGNKFVADNEELFKEQSMGDPPEHLIIENMDYGLYPSLRTQIVLDFFPDQMGAFMDTEGITRPSFMMKQAKKLSHILDIEIKGDGVTWGWGDKRQKKGN